MRKFFIATAFLPSMAFAQAPSLSMPQRAALERASAVANITHLAEAVQQLSARVDQLQTENESLKTVASKAADAAQVTDAKSAPEP